MLAAWSCWPVVPTCWDRAATRTLFLYAGATCRIQRSVTAVAARLARVDTIEEQRTYGDIAAGTAVRVVQIPGVVHGTVIASPVAFAEVVNWLDQVTGFPARAVLPALVANPLGSRLAWLEFVLVLPGLGLLLAQLAPAAPLDSMRTRWRDLALLPVAMLLPLPFLAVGRAGVLAGSSTADANVTHLALAGVLLVIGLRLGGGLRLLPFRLPAALLVAALGWLASACCWRRPVPTFTASADTGKALWHCSQHCAWPLALFTMAAHRWRGTLLRLASRVIIWRRWYGNALGVSAFRAIAILVLLAGPAIVEPLLAGFYARSRNVMTAAGIDALVTGWLFALFLPTTL
jgi:hypothetical protein